MPVWNLYAGNYLEVWARKAMRRRGIKATSVGASSVVGGGILYTQTPKTILTFYENIVYTILFIHVSFLF